MRAEDIQLLYEYDRWANDRVLQAMERLSSDQFTRDLGGSFRSVRDTFVHILAGEWNWLEYWKTPSPDAAFLADLKAQRTVLFNPESFPDIVAVHSKWKEVEKQQIEFVNSLTDELAQKMVPYRSNQISLGHLMQHLANHSTYHRGQLSLMMRQLKAEPTATDFHLFLAEGR
jgi:uncharacterized damage-inducible protein DinB